MNKFLNLLALVACLFTAACSDDNNNEPEAVTPIHFEKTDYTVKLYYSSAIPFTDGGGVYELKASNPGIFEKLEIDSESRNLLIYPVKTGESTLTVTDIKAGSSVTLRITVVDFYISFRITDIEGTNTNQYFQIGADIRFIRDDDNTKPVKVVVPQNNGNFTTVAEGRFDITRTEPKIFTMDFSLHSHIGQELEAFEYTMGGDAETLAVFESTFQFEWDRSTTANRSASPVREVRMTLTDNFNGCKITTRLQQLGNL